MGTKQSYIKPLSRSVVVYQPDTKRKLSSELGSLESDVTELSYKAWAIETFIVGINSVYSSILELSTEPKKKKAKEVIYKEVIKANPNLDPKEVYIDGNRLIFTKTKNPLTESTHWKKAEEYSNIPLINDFHQYFELSRQARKFDHTIETEYSKTLNMGIKIRIFSKKHKKDLMFGLCPKNKQQLKYYVANICIDSFHEIYRMLSTSNEVPLRDALNELYSWSIHLNPFLDLTLRQVKNINKTTATHQEATVGVQEEANNYKGRTSLSQVPKEELHFLESLLKSKVFGQDEAIEAVSNAYKRAVSGVKNPKTPVGAFLFYGGTSTGKTELARIVAKAITGSDQGLLKISCNTLQASHSTATLIGSPPGYAGYDQNGYLASHMEDSEMKVILFDEIDKAHPSIYDLLLEMLEEGSLLLANGEVLNFSECLIIFTSNMGQQEAKESTNTAGFSSEMTDNAKVEEDVFKQVLEKKLKPEFLSRLTGKFYFKQLNQENLVKSCSRYIEERTEHLLKNKIKLICPQEMGYSIFSEYRYEIDATTVINPRKLNAFTEDRVFKNLGDFLIKSNLLNHKKQLQIELIKHPTDAANNFLVNPKFKLVEETKAVKSQTKEDSK